MSARLMGAVIGLAVAAVWVSTARAGTVPGQLLVQLKPNLTLTERSPGLVPVVRSVRLVGRSGLALVEVDPRQADAAAAQLRRDRRIARVQPNYVYRALFTPNDPSFGYQWNFQKVEAAAAWDFDASAPLYGGDPAVVVAVLDSGVAFEDYQSYVRAPDFASTVFVAGTDVVNDDTHPNDDHGHGTHVTGTVAQSTNNGVAGAGLAFATSIMPIKVLDGTGIGTTADIAAGIDFARANGADVINLSLGGSSDDPILHTAIQQAVSAGIVVVAAAGNDGNNGLAYPARYDEVISVGATRFDDARAPYSNYGTGLDLVAPGGDLDVDQNGDGQPDGILQQTCTSSACSNFNDYYYEGTSQSAPHVSAAAALLLAAGIPSGNIRSVIEGSATDLGAAGYDTTFGWGRLNVSRALSIGLNDTVAPSGTVIISSDATYTNSTNVSLTLSASDQESNVSAMSFSNDGSTFLAWEPYATIRSGWDLTAAGGSEAEGVRRVYARFRDAAGNVSAVSTDDVIADYTQPTKPALTVRAAAPFDQVQIVSGVSTSVKSLTATWTAASDGLSGLAGYRIALSPQADADLSTQSLTQSQTYTTAALDSSRTLFLHLAAYDQAGNASATVSFVYVFQQLRVAAGTAGRQGTVTVVQTSGKVDQRVTPFGAQSVNGISVTSLTYVNGQPDYLAVVARQRARTVKIIAPNGKEVVSFSPYGRTVAGGVNLAGADLDGDGRSELLVAPRAGRLPVRVFSVEGKLIREMYPFGRTYSGGVSVAVAGEATEPSIVVGRLTGTPTVRILSKRGAYVRQFSAFPKSGTHGVNVAAGDVNGDGRDEVVVARATGNAEVRVYSLQKKQLKKFSVFSKSFNRGLGIATGDYDGDGRQEILTVPANGAAQVQLHAFSGKLVKRFFALPKSFRGGASLAGVQ